MNNRDRQRRVTRAALASALLYFGGCSSRPTELSVPDQRNVERTDGNGAGSSRILADMGQPDLALIVSGQLDGYLEPCGCAKGKAGGLIRRYELIERLRLQNWPIALIDLGGLIGDSVAQRGGKAQARIKAQHVLKALALLKYDALAANVNDLKGGVKETLSMYRDDLSAATNVVAGNLKLDAAFETRIRPSVVVTVGRVRLGITSVIDPVLMSTLVDPDKEKLLPVVIEPNQALPPILEDLESRTDHQVLIVQGSYEFATGLALANPGFEVVVATTDTVAPQSRHPAILHGGKTTLVTIGRRGHYVGVFAFSQDQPTRRPVFRVVALNHLYDGHGTPMKTLIQDDYRAALKAAGVVENFTRRNVDGPAGATFIGAEKCAKCHANTYKKWSTTRHSHAFDSLLNDPRPSTMFDAECVTCHTTGFPYVSGWRSQAATPYLAGNQCENCHGPGSSHAAEPGSATFRQPMIRSSDDARKALCRQCHDHDNSPDFDFGRYWSQIAHKGLDQP